MKKITLLGVCLLSTQAIISHQPVMDMAPRWQGGYGGQVRYELIQKRKLIQGTESIANSQDEREDTHKLSTEGIYTFTREHRVTLKVPYLYKEIGGSTNKEGQGFGDLILGMPNKLYFNKKGMTGNASLTPSVKFPSGKTGVVDLGSGSYDFGLSISGSAETILFYGLIDLFGWLNTDGREGARQGNTIGFDLDLGWSFYKNVKKSVGWVLLTSINGRSRGQDTLPDGTIDLNSGGYSLDVATGLLFYQVNIMGKVEYHIPVYRSLNGTQLSESRMIKAGIGIVF